MSARTIWFFGFSVFVLLMFVALAGIAGATTPSYGQRLAEAAIEHTQHTIRYDPSYVSIGYPLGDVPVDQGVCTDLVVRAFRKLGVDLQQLVHEDMTEAFGAYPKNWGLTRPDPNIDHRRVGNLRVFFSRHGDVVPPSMNAADFRSGDLVTWTIPGNLPHIGIVTDRRSADGERPLIVHNIGAGPKLEDRLFEFPITGHYRFDGADLGRLLVSPRAGASYD